MSHADSQRQSILLETSPHQASSSRVGSLLPLLLSPDLPAVYDPVLKQGLLVPAAALIFDVLRPSQLRAGADFEGLGILICLRFSSAAVDAGRSSVSNGSR